MKGHGELQKRSTMLRLREHPAGRSGLGLVWDRITVRWRGDERSERQTGNEYERRYFRVDLAAVRAHHDRRRSTNERDELDPSEKKARKREENEKRRVAPLPPRTAPRRRLIFHDSVVSYTVSTMAPRLAVPRFSYVCRVSNDAYRMDWKAMVGSIIDRSWHEEFKQPAWKGDRREVLGGRDEEIDGEERGNGREPSLGWEASIGRGRPSCWELLAAVPPGDKPLPATELP
ncbi:hypothetical protein DBV15_11022 [Temnothorax longispinosus]|uniref:Uncharacterized protein n=1 Tax=Temnothorax longispinosus TaxID=300112 RepID=A0A4S2KSE5_9HYME|nr:hypothetical protein DBV15_11022 [Temnothorax longispinosus]